MSGEILVSHRRADSRASTEPRVQFARGTSSNDTIERDAVRTTEFPHAPVAEHESQTGVQLARFKPTRTSWLGVVTTAPVVGTKIIIGTPMSTEFTVTSTVAKIFTRDDGALVQTTTNSRYFIAHSGDAYLVRRVG